MASTDLMDMAAALHVQRILRGFLGRMKALRQANEVYEKIFDPRTGAHYYYNTRTFATKWEPPAVVTRILGEFGDLESVAPTYGEAEAAVKLQAAWRRRRAARTMRALLSTIVSKIFDDTSGAFYYFNSLTGETSWSKPALFGSEDVENYLLGAPGPESREYGQGQENMDPLGTGSYGYEKGEEEREYQQGTQRQGEGGVSEGYEGWVWDDDSGWYYDEKVAAEQLSEVEIAAIPSLPDGGDSDGDDSDNSDSSSEIGNGEDGGGRKWQQRKRRAPPRTFPRSKAQRLVDEVEDSVEGAQPLSLNLNDLDMTRVTSRVYGCTWLESLDLSRNRLHRVSPDMGAMDSLINLDLRHNRLKTIPDELEALTRLQHLRVGYNRIEGFRGNIYLLTSLQTLDLGHNRMKQVPLCVGDLQLLKRTREWEIGLRLLKELLTLDVSYNKLEIWPPQVEGCTKLTSLRLDHNMLTEIPESLDEMKALTNLNLGNNSIRRLPRAVNSLTCLKSLDISHNGLEVAEILPIDRKRKEPRLLSLERLMLQRNELTKGPSATDTLKTLTELDRLAKMKVLRMNGVGLERCPEGLGKMGTLEILDISNNNIPVLDQAAGTLFKLKVLNLKNNMIEDLGSCVGNMMSLTYLNAGGNGMSILSPELSRCTRLEHLDISSGQLEFLDDGLSKLTKLRIFRVHDNYLTNVPSTMGSLTEMRELRVDGNRLRDLPDSLETMAELRYAELSRNLMESPPTVTRRWPLLQHLVLSRNPLKGRQRQSRRLLRAAQRGHEAMHRGDWEEATRHLNVAAEEYHSVIYTVPDFPEPDLTGGMDRGSSLAHTRPHHMDTFHHENLGLGHLGRARELKKDLENIINAGDRSQSSSRDSKAPKDGSSVSSTTHGTESASLDSSDIVSMGTEEREERRRKELDVMAKTKSRDFHVRAALEAFSCADRIQQQSLSLGRSVGVWLGRAAAYADAGDHASALGDLERASAHTRNRSKIRMLLARSRTDLGQFERALTECSVALRYLEQEERLLEKREAQQKRIEEEMVIQAGKAAAVRRAAERSAERERRLAAATGTTENKASRGESIVAEAEATASVGDNVIAGTEGISPSRVDVVQQDHYNDNSKSVLRDSVPPEESSVSVDNEIAPLTPLKSKTESTNQAKRGTRSEIDSYNGAGDGLPSSSSNDWGEQSSSPRLSIERAALESAKRELKDVKAQAEEGLELVKHAVDMADILRGFEMTKHGIPVRDMTKDRASLLQGRSVLRDRHRRIMAVERAHKRSRKHEVGLMERAMRQVSTRKEACRRAKVKHEAVMLKYREQDEAWERKKEEQMEEKTRLQAIADFEKAVKVQYSPVSDAQIMAKETVDVSLSRDSTGKAAGNSKGNPEDETIENNAESKTEEDDDDDEELQKMLAGRAGRGKRGGAASGRTGVSPVRGVASRGQGKTRR